jgi:hypothetical protein
MSETDQTPPQSQPLKEGGLRQPEPRPPSDDGLTKTGGGETHGDGREDGVGGMLGEGEAGEAASDED